MNKVLCFGELLMRLSPQLEGAWIRQNELPVFIGGAELNAATGLANWGVPVSYFTALPHNYLSLEILESLTAKGIDVSKVQFSGERIGTYYLPQGADLKNAGVIYDRAYSSFWNLQPGSIDWDEVLSGVSWFNFSAITPALNPNLAAVCLEAVKAASEKKITVSVDLNYRSRLWQYGKQPAEVMPALVQHCDIIMGNVWAEAGMLGIETDPGLADEEAACLQQSARSSAAIMERFPRCRQVANTFRFDRANGLYYYATLFDGTRLFASKRHQTAQVIDRVGSGDTFMAGLIYGNLNKFDAQEIIDFAAAAAFNKLFIKGDATTASVEEIRNAYINYA